ncbi:MAG: hypothetical protein AB7P76_10735 [Candidatus Melainabacteria bacterium]
MTEKIARGEVPTDGELKQLFHTLALESAKAESAEKKRRKQNYTAISFGICAQRKTSMQMTNTIKPIEKRRSFDMV